MEIQRRATILKGYETECYSICFYLLQCENKAIEAAKQALFNIIKDDKFFLNKDQHRDKWLRKASIKAALDIYKQQFVYNEYGSLCSNKPKE